LAAEIQPAKQFVLIKFRLRLSHYRFQRRNRLCQSGQHCFYPITTAQKTVFGIDYVTSIAMSASSANSITQAENDSGYLLLQRHKISDPTQADFSMVSQSDILSAASSVTGTFTALLAGLLPFRF